MFARTNICIQTYNGTENVPLDWRRAHGEYNVITSDANLGKSHLITDSVLNK